MGTCRFYGEDRNTVIIKGLPEVITTEKLIKQLFSRYGSVKRCKLIPPGTAALVQMTDQDEAMTAIQGLNHTYLDEGFGGKQGVKPRMQVRYAKDTKEDKGEKSEAENGGKSEAEEIVFSALS